MRGVTPFPAVAWASRATLVVWTGLAVVAARRYRLTSTVFAPVLPVCWMMNRAATWRGLHQLIRAPFLWEKTPHTNSKPAAVQATTVKSRPDRPVAELTLAA